LAETGTFLSRDPVENEPPYLYARGNSVNITDPSGRYGLDVHYSRTFSWVFELASSFGLFDVALRLAAEVAKGDQHVDDVWWVLDTVLGCNDCHFASLQKTMAHVNEAIYFSDKPYLFGATLHQYQDWFSHWGEGYNQKHGIWYEHVTHSEGGLHRPQPLINEFYQAYPKREVIQEVKTRNPGFVSYTIPMDELDDILIDLYLRDFVDSRLWKKNSNFSLVRVAVSAGLVLLNFMLMLSGLAFLSFLIAMLTSETTVCKY
jgi:hypothetical protein